MERRYILPVLLGIIILYTLIVYSPVIKNNFLNWDDNAFIVDNEDIRNINLENIKNWVSQKYNDNYLPLTIFSYAVDYKIDGLDARVFASTNLIFHLINACLVFWLILLILRYIDNKNEVSYHNSKNNSYLIAFIVSLLFAIHPLNVEAIAWLSERKNLLYSFFYLLSIICYIRYIKKNNYWIFILSIFLFLLSLLSKGVAVSLSLSIVAIDYLFYRKIFSTKVILEKIPYFLLSVVFGIITFQSTNNGIIKSGFPLYERFTCASNAFFLYLYKLCLPVNLCAFYPFPRKVLFLYWIYFFIIVIAFTLIIVYRKKISRVKIFAILFYIINIIFLVQLIPFGYSIIAERYIYISSIGFFLLFAILLVKYIPQYFLFAFLIVLLVLFGHITHDRVKIWNNSLQFWDDVIKKYHNEYIPEAWNNRGTAKEGKGDLKGSLEDYIMAIKLKPDYTVAYFNKAEVEKSMGNYTASLNDFNMAININPVYQKAYFGMAEVKELQGNYNGAIDDLNHTLKISPLYKNAYIKIGEIKEKSEDYIGAKETYQKAVNIIPNFKEAYYALGNLYIKRKKFSRSIENLNMAITIMPQFKEAYNLRGIDNFYLKKTNDAKKDFTQAIKLDTTFSEAYYNRANLYKILNENENSLKDINKAILFNPKYLNAYILRAKLRIRKRDYIHAIEDCNAVIKLNKKNLTAISLKAHTLQMAGKINDAIIEYSRAIVIAPDSVVYYYKRGILEIMINNKAAGKDDLLQAKKMGYVFTDDEIKNFLK